MDNNLYPVGDRLVNTIELYDILTKPLAHDWTRGGISETLLPIMLAAEESAEITSDHSENTQLEE